MCVKVVSVAISDHLILLVQCTDVIGRQKRNLSESNSEAKRLDASFHPTQQLKLSRGNHGLYTSAAECECNSDIHFEVQELTQRQRAAVPAALATAAFTLIPLSKVHAETPDIDLDAVSVFSNNSSMQSSGLPPLVAFARLVSERYNSCCSHIHYADPPETYIR